MLKSDIQLLNDGMQVLKPMLTQLKPKNMIDLYFEVLPFEQAFSSILSLLIGVMTIPVSSTPTERTFSKMKLIKTVTQSTSPCLLLRRPYISIRGKKQQQPDII
ncbi:unnamed protein product [Rotaria socialis]|uniref:HAT C-terminal dimerisation domain-containing protein n=1 Tax=Rotaria socialis TaxID=392032 RepID=A0A818P687_9BILA|nr:unnamed protein product [Rotaria socialis]CAF3616103.1 unnamed protein product [Rotaria socialis]